MRDRGINFSCSSCIWTRFVFYQPLIKGFPFQQQRTKIPDVVTAAARGMVLSMALTAWGSTADVQNFCSDFQHCNCFPMICLLLTILSCSLRLQLKDHFSNSHYVIFFLNPLSPIHLLNSKQSACFLFSETACGISPFFPYLSPKHSSAI